MKGLFTFAMVGLSRSVGAEVECHTCYTPTGPYTFRNINPKIELRSDGMCELTVGLGWYHKAYKHAGEYISESGYQVINRLVYLPNQRIDGLDIIMGRLTLNPNNIQLQRDSFNSCDMLHAVTYATTCKLPEGGYTEVCNGVHVKQISYDTCVLTAQCKGKNDVGDYKHHEIHYAPWNRLNGVELVNKSLTVSNFKAESIHMDILPSLHFRSLSLVPSLVSVFDLYSALLAQQNTTSDSANPGKKNLRGTVQKQNDYKIANNVIIAKAINKPLLFYVNNWVVHDEISQMGNCPRINEGIEILILSMFLVAMLSQLNEQSCIEFAMTKSRKLFAKNKLS